MAAVTSRFAGPSGVFRVPVKPSLPEAAEQLRLAIGAHASPGDPLLTMGETMAGAMEALHGTLCRDAERRDAHLLALGSVAKGIQDGATAAVREAVALAGPEMARAAALAVRAALDALARRQRWRIAAAVGVPAVLALLGGGAAGWALRGSGLAAGVDEMRAALAQAQCHEHEFVPVGGGRACQVNLWIETPEPAAGKGGT